MVSPMTWCSLLSVLLSPVHTVTGNKVAFNTTRWTSLKVDCCRDQQQSGNKVDCCRYGRLCFRFWQQIGNNLNLTVCRGRLCCQYGRLCCQCVRGQSDRVDFVDFQQSRLCQILWFFDLVYLLRHTKSTVLHSTLSPVYNGLKGYHQNFLLCNNNEIIAYIADLFNSFCEEVYVAFNAATNYR